MVHFKFGRREGNIFLFNVRKTSWWPHQIFLMICLVLTAIVVQSLTENNGIELETRHFRKELGQEIQNCEEYWLESNPVYIIQLSGEASWNWRAFYWLPRRVFESLEVLFSVEIKESFDRRLINTNISIVALSIQNHD